MGTPGKAQELRDLLAVAIKLRLFSTSPECDDSGLFQAAADALDRRAKRIAYGAEDEPLPAPREKIDMVC